MRSDGLSRGNCNAAMVLLLTGGLGGPRNRDCPRHQPLDRLPLMSRREVRVARDYAQGLLPAELLDREEVHLFIANREAKVWRACRGDGSP